MLERAPDAGEHGAGDVAAAGDECAHRVDIPLRDGFTEHGGHPGLTQYRVGLAARLRVTPEHGGQPGRDRVGQFEARLGAEPAGREVVAAATGGVTGAERPAITVELRRNGRPVDIVPLVGLG